MKKSPRRPGRIARVDRRPAAATPPPAMLGSTVFALERLAVKRTPVGEFRPVADGPTPAFDRFEMHVTRLNPGLSSHAPHHHPQEELLLVREGTVELWINGEKKRAGAGSVVFFAAHDLHGLTNVGRAPATYYVINFFSAATATVRDQPAAQQAGPRQLHSTVIDWAALKAKRTPTGWRRRVVSSPTLTFANLAIFVSTLYPGAPAGRLRRHPGAKLIIVKHGTIAVDVNGSVKRSGPGSIVYLAARDLHRVSNAGPAPATCFVFAVLPAPAKVRPVG